MVWVLSPAGSPAYVSRDYERFAATVASDGQAWTWSDALAPASLDALRAALGRRQDFSLALELRAAADGQARLECNAHWLERLGHFVCLLHDVSAAHHSDAAARLSAGQLRLLADNMPALIAYYNARTLRCEFANRHYAQTFGLDEESIVGRTIGEIIGEEGAREVTPHVERVIRERRTVVYERLAQVEGGGPPRWLSVHMVPQLDADSVPVGGFVLVTDITKARQAEMALRESEERLSKFMHASAEGILFHRDGRITDANPAACTLLGWSQPELLGLPTIEFVAADHAAAAQAVMRSGAETTHESVLVHRSGRRVPVELIVRSLERNGERLDMTIVRDIRDRREAQARIHYLAHHDSLTGLPNRATFLDQVERQLALAGQTPLALLFIDLDGFKRVNDSLGHLAGDRLLQAVGTRIRASLRSSDAVARFGGDEFIVMLPQATERPLAEEVARKLLVAIQQPMKLDGHAISVSASVGIAMFPADGQQALELLQRADKAMYLAKAGGRSSLQFFDPARADTAYEALVLEAEIADALRREQFELHFQPQVRADDGALLGVEALLRWNHPERGLMLPDQFIPVAEQQRLTVPLGNWVLREALRNARRWQGLGHACGPVAVNLSNQQLRANGLVEGLRDLFRERRGDGALLELEITERTLLDDLPDVLERLVELKALGLRLSVDDFGTGYFSPRHLKELPIDKVKIDRSFVGDLPHAEGSVAIARAIIQMAGCLGKHVVAEGVENEAQCRFLAEHGCYALQGNAVAPPLTAAQFEAWLHRRGTAGNGPPPS